MKVVLVVLVVAVAAFGLLLLLEAIPEATISQILLLTALITASMGVAIALRPERRLPLLADPLFLTCFFFGQFYVVGALGMGLRGLRPLPFLRPPAPETAVLALAAFLFMFVLFVVGYFGRAGVLLGRLLPSFELGSRRLPGIWGEMLILGVGIGGCIAWLEAQGGLLARLSRSYGVGSGGAIFTFGHFMVLLGGLLMAWRIVNAERRRAIGVVLFGAYLLGFALFFGLVFGSRKYLLYLFFGVVTIWLLRRGLASLPKVRTGIALVLVLLFFAYWGTLRAKPVTALVGQTSDSQYAEAPHASETYLYSLVEPFGVACVVLETWPAQEQFRHGRTLLVTVLGFIPRSMWPEKPIGIGKEITRYYVGPFYEEARGHSLTITIPADFYVNFGWFGIAMGGFLLGVACRAMATYAAEGMVGGRQVRAARVLIPAVFIIGLGEVRSDVATMLALYVLMAIPLLFVLVFCRLDDHRVAAPSEIVGVPAPDAAYK